MPAVEVWFLGGPADGRVAPIEVDQTTALPLTVQLLQAGFYHGTADHPDPNTEHWYSLVNHTDSPPVYRYITSTDT